MKGEKSLKILAKEAKNRLKNGFWEKYKDNVVDSFEKAKAEGVDASRVIGYYEAKVSSVKITDESEIFYSKVKKLLEEYGERGNIISMLIDYSVYDSLSYEKTQKYVLELSEKYRKALERYKREKSFSN
ncbi:MAG: hypothetical protein J6Y44_00830 [Clostridia bacterium]|nr:hypothetical protein [Clostridia bacterium]